MRIRPLLRRLSSLGRIVVALALLAGLWVAIVMAVDDATDRSQAGRFADRQQLARVLSQPVADWVLAAQQESRELAATVGDLRGQAGRVAIDGYLRSGRAFARSALVLDDRNLVVTASGDRFATVDRVLSPCHIDGTNDPSFDAAIASRSGGLSSILAMPGTCRPGVVSAVGVGGVTVVAFGDLADLGTRLDNVAALARPLRIRAVDSGTGYVVPEEPQVGTIPEGVAAVVGDRVRPVTARFFSGNADVVGAFQPTGAGWGILVTQFADDFDVAPNNRPALKVAALLTAAFAAVFVLVAWFDVRRRRAAKRADADRNAFLAIVGHELRTPLTVIKGYTETLAARWDALDDPSRQMLVENMAPQTQRQARVIEHLLTAASLQAGTAPRLELSPTDVGPVVSRVVADFRALAPLHRFDVDLPLAVPVARCDPTALGQALGELVDNAVRFSPSGGLVRIGVSSARRHIEISVEDEGVGLPAETARLFRPFSQVEDVDRRVHAEGGVGVGLFIARSLLEQMGGSVRAEHRQERGARLVVRLLAAAPTTANPLERARP